MIKATFYKDSEKGSFFGFNIKGHSGYAESGSDIVCAAISSMVMLFVNTAEGALGVPFDFESDEESALMDFRFKAESEFAIKSLMCFYECVKSVSEDYPAFVKVTEKMLKR
jgi:uncharacterized protein YsxB (DUF464 family)